MNTDVIKGKVVFLTGAGSGIGKALVEKLTQLGAQVIACDVSPLVMSEFKRARCDSIDLRQLDVTDRAAYKKLADSIIGEYGGVDYLVSNAGVTCLAEAQDFDIEHWRNLLEVNVRGVINGIQIFYPMMIKRLSGQIVNVSSLAALTGYATAAPYTFSKAFVVGLTRSLRPEAKKYGVGLSLVVPGYVDTDIFKEDLVEGSKLEDVKREMPFRSITSSEAADCIAKGMIKGKKEIVFPFSTKVLWCVARLFPMFLYPFQNNLLKPFRK